MREPTRWRDTADAPAGARDLLRGASPTPALRADAKARSARRIAALATIPIAAGAWFWVTGVALAATVGVGASVVVARHVFPSLLARSAPPPSSLTTPSRLAASPSGPEGDDRAPLHEEVAAAISAPSAAARPAPRMGQVEAARPAPRPLDRLPQSAPPRATSAPSPDDDALARETAVLEQARSRLASDPSAALALLSRSAARSPRSQLGVERELLSVDALERLGRTHEARARGESLLARVRGTLYEGRVEGLLARLP